MLLTEAIEPGDRLAYQTAIVLARVSLDPLVIGIAGASRRRIREQPLATLAVADNTGRKRYLQVEQVAGQTTLQYNRV